ncbi:MAG: ABC transporter substrate-binding protein [Thermodesulfobacteriota bacterium]|nr:ABC transporter substrate-binding protein [Thermodesulfobacteriota bacterium]
MDKMMKVVLCAFFLHFVLFPTPHDSAAQEIKIGIVSCLTGPAAFYGTYMKKGVDLAIEEINAKGGIKGSKIAPIWEDDKGTPTAAVSAIKKLISVDRVPVVVGSLTATALAMIPVADKENTVFITSLSTHPDIAKMSKWSFRNCINTVPSAMAVVDFAYKQQGKRKLGILFFQNESTRRIAEGVKKRFEELGGTVVGMEMLAEEGVDYRSPIIKIKNANPDSIYIAAFARQGGLAMKQLVESGVNLQFYADPIESPVWLQTAGSAANGAIYGYLDIQQSFLDKYKSKYNEEGEIWGALYYDTMYTLTIAIEKGGYTAEGIRKSLIEIKDYPGITGAITYGPERDVIKPPIIKMVKDGKFMKHQ